MYIIVQPNGNVVGGFDDIKKAEQALNADSKNARLWQVDLSGAIDITENQKDYNARQNCLHSAR